MTKKEFDNKKKFSLITFLMVRPLVEQFSKRKNYCKNSLPRGAMFTSQNKL